MNALFLFIVRQYRRLISPLLGRRCRFFPSCSDYAEQALMKKSAPRACGLIFKRLLKCHPFYSGGYDPLES